MPRKLVIYDNYDKERASYETCISNALVIYFAYIYMGGHQGNYREIPSTHICLHTGLLAVVPSGIVNKCKYLDIFSFNVEK